MKKVFEFLRGGFIGVLVAGTFLLMAKLIYLFLQFAFGYIGGWSVLLLPLIMGFVIGGLNNLDK